MKIKIGDTVVIRPSFGMEPPISVKVTGLGEHKGRPVLDYVDGDDSRWAYEAQVVGRRIE